MSCACKQARLDSSFLQSFCKELRARSCEASVSEIHADNTAACMGYLPRKKYLSRHGPIIRNAFLCVLCVVLLVFYEVVLCPKTGDIDLAVGKLAAVAEGTRTPSEPPPAENAKISPSSLIGTRLVHVVFTCDAKSESQRRLLAAAVNSVAVNSREPERLVIHVFVEVDSNRSISEMLGCVLPNSNSRVIVHATDFQVDLPITVRYPGIAEKRLLNPANYLRFFLADLLQPDVTKVLYLDTDVIVFKDVSKMYDNYLLDPTSVVLAAAKRDKRLSEYANFSDRAVIDSGVSPDTTAFNAGVLLIRLDIWRAQNITEKVRHWMQLNKEHPIYELGSQPPLLLSIGDNYEKLDASWNADGAGFKQLDDQQVSEAKIMHWTGSTKGDKPEAFHRDIWLKYDIPNCFSKR
jgi:lipopolysaccharide biosynthesis glycosyltransferase